MSKTLNIGLFGYGCVGRGLYEVLNRSGLFDSHIRHIVVKDPAKSRNLPADRFAYDPEVILSDSSVNVVVELINDSEAAFAIVSEALRRGKHVVSANKKLVAEHQDALVRLARENRVSFLYEAAVAGSIPILRNLEEYYNNDSLSSVTGIVNGTCNYILTQFDRGIDYKEALAEAQEKGFAETDPTLDVDGFDARFKLCLLIRHAFGTLVQPEELVHVGIRNISGEDIRFAREKGLRIRLLAHVERLGDQLFSFVAPHFVRPGDFAFGIREEFNAVQVQGAFADTQLFTGKGAGSLPTAAAVLSDVSALRYDYRYEYRKSEGKVPELSADFYVKIYAGSANSGKVDEIPFLLEEERFRSTRYTYRTGWIRFADLLNTDFNSRQDLSVLVLPDGIRQELPSFVSETENALV